MAGRADGGSQERPADAEKGRNLSEPRGPFYGHVDEASGGADSSPLENEPTGERMHPEERPGEAGHRPSRDLPQDSG